jgi:sulfur carrier protein
MRIMLNGQSHDVQEGLSLAGLLAALDLAGKRVAVERNGEIAPRSRHADIQLQADDRIEIVQAIGGG